MVVWRIRIVELIDQRFERLLLRRGPPQLQEHVLHHHAVGDSAAVVRSNPGFGAGVAAQCDQVGFIDRARDRWLGLRPHEGLGAGRQSEGKMKQRGQKDLGDGADLGRSANEQAAAAFVRKPGLESDKPQEILTHNTRGVRSEFAVGDNSPL